MRQLSWRGAGGDLGLLLSYCCCVTVAPDTRPSRCWMKSNRRVFQSDVDSQGVRCHLVHLDAPVKSTSVRPSRQRGNDSVSSGSHVCSVDASNCLRRERCGDCQQIPPRWLPHWLHAVVTTTSRAPCGPLSNCPRDYSSPMTSFDEKPHCLWISLSG